VRRACGCGLAVAVAALAFAFGFVSFDANPYGVSIGTDTHYCSVEARVPFVTCEAAR